MNQNAQTLRADAHPSKAFFTETLPRDIPLSDCILDLVDNSIHRLITPTGLDVSEHLVAGTKAARISVAVDVAFDPSKFTIKDDCGGISIDDAREQVFRFGEPVKQKTQAGLGVYGIGMKRAFFKIGKQISIASRTIDEKFRIDIDVDDWMKNDAWDFPFTYARKENSKTGGTDIDISKLYPAVSEQFASKAFRGILVEKMSRVFALFLKAGLKIKVNAEACLPDIPELAESKDLRAVRHMFKKDGVDVLIMAGLSPKHDRKPRGWYVFCNGRMVLDADKTEKTGWGTDSHPAFHVKYNHFLAYVYFRSQEVQKLPWTTTKDGVDRESPIYQTALSEMRLLSRPILDFLNTFYEDVKEQSEPERAVFEKARPVSPLKIAVRQNTPFEVRVKKTADDELVSIQYPRPNKKLRRIREVLGRSSMSASRIGQYTFDWFYDRNCK
ncbi:MAG: ATP-binding protein [Bryobacteraceae bacterium]